MSTPLFFLAPHIGELERVLVGGFAQGGSEPSEAHNLVAAGSTPAPASFPAACEVPAGVGRMSVKKQRGGASASSGSRRVCA